MLRAILTFVVVIWVALPGIAQEAGGERIDRSATGGAQTLEDILARQRGETVDPGFRQKFGGDATARLLGPLGTAGGASDPDLWRALRYGAADVRVVNGDQVDAVVMQDGGIAWYEYRQGPLITYGGFLLLGTILALLLFFLLRGRIGLVHEETGRMVMRFRAIERFAHWLLAGSFILLALTGLVVLMGRFFIAPTFGKEANAILLSLSKLVHNNVSWAFMLGLIMVFVFWVAHNFPSRSDLKWIAQFGGVIGNKHPPARKPDGNLPDNKTDNGAGESPDNPHGNDRRECHDSAD